MKNNLKLILIFKKLNMLYLANYMTYFKFIKSLNKQIILKMKTLF